MRLLDSLTTISPITDVIQLPQIAKGATQTKAPRDGEDTPPASYSEDFMISSGNQVKSYLTFLSQAIPLVENALSLGHLAPTSDSERVQLERVFSTPKHVFINFTRYSTTED